MKAQYPTFTVTGTESLPPNDSKAGDIFSRLGYRIADAIADLVDNSVDAHARHVLVRFVKSNIGVHRVVIADDGEGMSRDELREAMRFGSSITKSGKQLGKYGIGLKSASLSQADVVTVLSKQRRQSVGRRWTLQNVKKGWTCEILDDRSVSEAFKSGFGEFQIRDSGTIVMWEQLEHLRALPENLDRVLQKTTDELCVELGIRFHRFLESKRVSLAVDQQAAMDDEPKVQRFVTPLNPFDYPASGRADYPVALNLTVDGTKFSAKCHIWPPKSTSPGYRLGGGKVALRQGFYFYRNDRVIQAGGWNTFRADDGEPHLSLARVEVDLPSSLDSMFKLDVTKSHLDPSPEFIRAMSLATTRGATFAKFLDDADKVYRHQKKKDRARFPVIPGAGLSGRAGKAIGTILHEAGTGKPRRVSFKWKKLDSDEIVRLDPEYGVILLNTMFRSQLYEGNSNDAPVLKVALMFLFQNELEKIHVTKKAQDWLLRVNQSLIAALKEG